MKQCSSCGAFKVRDDFSRNSSRKDGLQHACKACCAARQKGRKHKPGSQNTGRRRLWRYGITGCEFTRLRIEQGDLCAICRQGPAEHIDHSHESGKVRGLLCGGCNRGLGQFDDDPERISAAVAYLTR